MFNNHIARNHLGILFLLVVSPFLCGCLGGGGGSSSSGSASLGSLFAAPETTDPESTPKVMMLASLPDSEGTPDDTGDPTLTITSDKLAKVHNPEPATLLLFGPGLFALKRFRQKR